MKKIILLTLITIGTLTNYAQTFINENFDYTTNDSIAAVGINNNWVAITGITTNAIRANGIGISLTGYPSNSNGIGASASLTTSGQDAYRDISTPITTGNVYVSFLANVSAAQATGDYFFALLPNTSTSTFAARTFIKSSTTAGFFNVGIMKSSGTITFDTTRFPLSTPLLFVVKYMFKTGSTTDDSMYLFVSSNVPLTEPNFATASAFNGTQTDNANVGRIVLRQGSATNAPTLTIDGIRVASTWGNSVLPVKFSSFNAIINNKQTNLTWTTASEINNKGFEIERSFDGVNFEIIGFVKGNVNSNRANKYSFIDDNYVSAFYRLKQIDFDGKFDFSNVISVKGNDLLINITPNPFNNVIEINSNGQLVNVEVLDITGKVVITEVISGSKNTLNTASLINGVYFIRMNNGESIVTKRIIKN